MIFMNLESREMVKSRRIQKRFLQIIDGSKRNWRSLILPVKLEFWDPAILEMFDQNSGSSITEISVRFKHYALENNPRSEAKRFFDTLARSKASLQSLLLQGPPLTEGELPFSVEGFPNLVDLRLSNSFEPIQPKVSLSVRQDQDQDQSSKYLRILWCPEAGYCQGASFGHLTSLSIEEVMEASEWRRLLEGPSKTLRHLRMFIYDSDNLNELELPRLQVLQFKKQFWEDPTFPSWLRFPFSCKLLLEQVRLPVGLPSVSELWIGDDGIIEPNDWEEELGDRCPLLETLRFDSKREKKAEFAAEPLLYLLWKRRQNVEAGLEVDGVKMIPLKRLVVNMSIINWGELVLSEVQKSVEEIVDLDTVPEKVEVEV